MIHVIATEHLVMCNRRVYERSSCYVKQYSCGPALLPGEFQGDVESGPSLPCTLDIVCEWSLLQDWAHEHAKR